MLKFFITLITPLFLFSQTILEFESEGMKIKVEKIASNLGIPWGMTFIDEKKLLFTTRDGKFGILNIKTKKINYINVSLELFSKGQGGVLDIQVSPNFEKDKTVYFTYVKNLSGLGATSLAKAYFTDDKLVNITDLLVTNSISDKTVHFGSRIAFDEDGHLFFTIGDRGVRDNAQNLNNHAGTIIRLNLDGTIPTDNPFLNQKNILPEIYSYGHRNPQGIFYDESRKILFSCEHGPRGGDEINIIKKSLNYGWPIVSHGKEYWAPIDVGEAKEKDGMEKAIKVYIPSIAPSSLIVYNGIKFKKWNGNLFLGALVLTHLNRVVLDKGGKVIKEERLLESLKERIRNIIQDKEGNIFLSTDSGNIYGLKLK